ncbi:hypothetical protein [Haloplanus halobius]|nr:hypothetical protein [Haloplanus sp. XH21]
MVPLTGSADPTAPATCPSCGADVLNVQGIHACSACRWIDPDHR